MEFQSRNRNQLYPVFSSNTSNITNNSTRVIPNNTQSSVEVALIIIGGIVVGLIIFVFLFKCRCIEICWINILHIFYRCCCFRLDCTSHLNPNEAIMRYTEESLLDTEDFTNQVTSNIYIKCILHSFARQLPEFFFSILPSGSLSEGFGRILPSTSVLASDYDIMLIPDAVLVGHSTKIYVGHERPLFATVECEEIEEGFLWLKLENEYIKQWKKLCIRRQTESEGYSYLSSHKVHDLITDTFGTEAWWLCIMASKIVEKRDDLDLEIAQNGPALTIKMKGKGMKCCKSLCRCCMKERDDTKFYCDLTFSLHCPEWPAASNWFYSERRRWWPSQNTMNKIREIGCHVVPKPSTDSVIKFHQDQPTNTTFSQSPGLEWRYSFSQPEMFVAKEIPENVRSAYLALKAVNKKYLSKGSDKNRLSYPIKCVLLQVMEETQPQYWMQDHDVVEIFFKMLDILHQHLRNRVLPHYWIPRINLIKDLDIPTLDLLCQKINTVRSNPQDFVADNWLELTRWLRFNCCSFCAFGEGAQLCKCLPKAPQCPLCYISYSYSDNAGCLGSCPYDKLHMDVY